MYPLHRLLQHPASQRSSPSFSAIQFNDIQFKDMHADQRGRAEISNTHRPLGGSSLSAQVHRTYFATRFLSRLHSGLSPSLIIAFDLGERCHSHLVCDESAGIETSTTFGVCPASFEGIKSALGGYAIKRLCARLGYLKP